MATQQYMNSDKFSYDWTWIWWTTDLRQFSYHGFSYKLLLRPPLFLDLQESSHRKMFLEMSILEKKVNFLETTWSDSNVLILSNQNTWEMAANTHHNKDIRKAVDNLIRVVQASSCKFNNLRSNERLRASGMATLLHDYKPLDTALKINVFTVCCSDYVWYVRATWVRAGLLLHFSHSQLTLRGLALAIA